MGLWIIFKSTDNPKPKIKIVFIVPILPLYFTLSEKVIDSTHKW